MKRIFCLCFFIAISLNQVFSQASLYEKAESYTYLDSNIFYGEKYLDYCLRSNSKETTKAYRYLISNYLDNENFQKAKRKVDSVFQIAKKKSDFELQFVSINMLGKIEKYKKNFSKGLSFYLKAFDLLEKNEYWESLCHCTTDIAELNRSIAKYNEAWLYAMKALELIKVHKIKNDQLLARIYGRMAAIKNETEEIDSAIIFTKKSLDIYRLTNNKNAQACAWNELGYSYRHLKSIKPAEDCFRKAEQIWFSIGADNLAINAINNRAALYVYIKAPSKKILPLYFQIIDIVNKEKLDYDIDEVYKNVRNEYCRMGDTVAAYKYFVLFYETNSKRLERMRNAAIEDAIAKYENDKIKEKIKKVSGELTESNEIINKKNFENKLILGVLLVFGVLLFGIVYLWFKLKKSNDVLKNKNKEKDVLIQEIHHRVKNNLQFVSSLLNMQTNSSTSERDIYTLGDASRRVRAMALVHEMLYNQDELNGVEIKNYLEELIKSINDLVNTNKLPIEFNMEIDNCFFDTNKSIALGMITSELVSNSIKYAFTRDKLAKISISLKNLNNQILFVVSDNGVGYDFTKDENNKLGMRLIGIFSRQLKGEYDFISKDGLQYQLKFHL